MADPRALAAEIAAAYAGKQLIPAPTVREGGLDLAGAYAIDAQRPAAASCGATSTSFSRAVFKLNAMPAAISAIAALP